MPTTSFDSTTAAVYRLVWRWHFIAGLLVLPFLVMMAFTGGIYLYKPELDHLIYRRIEEVPARGTSFAPLAKVLAEVENSQHARVLEVTPTTSRTGTVRLTAKNLADKALTIYADPYDGHVTGTMANGGILQVVRKVHSLQQFGFWASCLIELAAGWTMLLVGTGIFLWWPRNRSGADALRVRGTPRERLFWRDLHAVVGLIAGFVIFFLALTGMPWSMFWGDHFQEWANEGHLGRPSSPACSAPARHIPAIASGMPHASHHADPSPVARPWAVANQQMSSETANGAPLDIDQARARFAAAGLPGYSSISLPKGATDTYTATFDPGAADRVRVVYLDQYSGRILGDVGFHDFGLVAKGVEWGIAVHQGQQYGTTNRLLMLLGCIAIVVLAVSAVTMWLKRKPRGSWGIPPAPPEAGRGQGFIAIVIGVGILFPLVGASLLAAFLWHTIAPRMIRHVDP